MTAAESGEQRAARMQARAEQLEHEARDKLAQAARLQEQASRIDKGNEGERIIGSLLDELAPEGWVVLHDRRRTASSVANIDHLLVGPPGVCVIDAKNWRPARVSLDEHGMKVGGYRKDRELDVTRLVSDGVQATARRCVPSVVSCGVLAFVGDMGLAAPVYEHGVVVLQREHLLPWLRSLPAVLDPQSVRRLAVTLEAAYGPRTAPVNRTVPRTSTGSRSPVSRTGPRRAPASTRLSSAGGSTRSRSAARQELVRAAAAAVAVLGLGWGSLHVLPGLAEAAAQSVVHSLPTGAPTPRPTLAPAHRTAVPVGAPGTRRAAARPGPRSSSRP